MKGRRQFLFISPNNTLFNNVIFIRERQVYYGKMRKSFSLSLPLTVCPKNALKSQTKIFRLLGVKLLPENYACLV